MNGCCGDTCETPTGKFFSKWSKKYARAFRKGKLDKPQKAILAAVRERGVAGRSLLEVGCGVGALHLTMLEEGASTAVGVDMSEEMLNHARRFAEQKGLSERTTYINDDVVKVAGTLAASDITVMDKVVCCYEHLPELLRTVLGKTRSVLALSHPRDNWLMKPVFKTQIFFSVLFRTDFRPWWHDWEEMARTIEKEGMRNVKVEETMMWKILVFERK